MEQSVLNVINAKAAARQEADALAEAATRQHRMAQKAARERMYNRAINTAFRRHTQLVALDGVLVGVIIASLLVIALCEIL